MAGRWKSSVLGNCLLELVLNSLNAEATAIAIRTDVDKRKIQVIDNGCGIAKNDLQYVGEYRTHHKISDKFPSAQKEVSSRGQNLLEIRKLSSILIIMSRCRFSSDTYGKIFATGKISDIRQIENRPSCGTTVTIYTLDVFCDWSEIDSFAIRYLIAFLALVNTQVSFSVRDDTSRCILLRIGKRQKHRQLLRIVCEKSLMKDQVYHVKPPVYGTMEMEFFWGFECTNFRKIQQIFLNLRPVNCSLLHNLIIHMLLKFGHETSNFSLEKVFFLLYIKCPNLENKIRIEDNQKNVEFYRNDNIVNFLKKFLRENYSIKSNASKSLKYKPIIAPLKFRISNKLAGVKQKRSFLMKSADKRKLRNKGVKREIARLTNEKSSNPIKDHITVTRCDANKDFPVLECASLDKIITMSQMSQRCIKQTETSSEKFVTKMQNENPCEIQLREHHAHNNHDIAWISQKCVEEVSNSTHERFTIDVGSQWSNWTYQPETVQRKRENQSEADHPIIWKRFSKFLPLKLHALIPYGNRKLISRHPLENDRLLFNLNPNRHKDLEVRGCKGYTFEFKLKVESLKSMKVLNQVNHNFIVASTKQDDKRLLVIIDQHAMHERIRYENLLRAFKRDVMNHQVLSVALQHPIIISDLSTRTCSLLMANSFLPAQYGLELSHRNANTLLILAVPRCFLKKTFYVDKTKLEIAVGKMLQEIIEDLTLNNGTKKLLPLTIHDALASEACHGAIKFGDPLTREQCHILVSHWKQTDAPNRCAHGRPSVIPLLELSPHSINQRKSIREKLNFAVLRKSVG